MQGEKGEKKNLLRDIIFLYHLWLHIYGAVATWVTLNSLFARCGVSRCISNRHLLFVRQGERLFQGQGCHAVQTFSSSLLLSNAIALHIPSCTTNSRSSKAWRCLCPVSPTYPSPVASESSCIPK